MCVFRRVSISNVTEYSFTSTVDPTDRRRYGCKLDDISNNIIVVYAMMLFLDTGEPLRICVSDLFVDIHWT